MHVVTSTHATQYFEIQKKVKRQALHEVRYVGLDSYILSF